MINLQKEVLEDEFNALQEEHAELILLKDKLKTHNKHLIKKNMEWEVKITMILDTLTDALLEGDIGEVSDYNIKELLKGLKNFNESEATISEVWLKLAGMTRALWQIENAMCEGSICSQMYYQDIAHEALSLYGVEYSDEDFIG